MIKSVLLLLLAVLLAGCNEEEVNALKEQNAKLQRQLDELAAAQKTKAEEEAAALAKEEEEKAAAAEEAKRQSANLKKEVLVLANQMADKRYGGDDEIRYVDLFKALLASHPNAKNKPSLITFNVIAQRWADWKKGAIEEAQFAAEEKKSQLENQIEQLLTLRDEELIDFAVGLQIPGSQVPVLRARLQQSRLNLATMEASGLGRKHPSIEMALIAQDKMNEDLKEAVVVLRELLEEMLGLVNGKRAELLLIHRQRRESFLLSIEKLFE